MGSDELPASVIQRIQSFLPPKQSGRTTLLSKSWLRAWSTCPTVDIDQSHFPSARNYTSKIDPLVEFAMKTFGKYEEFNVKKIDTFRLCVETEWYGLSGLATRWTLKALEMGATDLTFRFDHQNSIYIPIDEVFGYQNLVRLCLEGSNIDQLKVIKCSGLKSLTLSNMEISSALFFNILSCCPLIEDLSLSNISSCGSGQKMTSSLDKLTSLVMCHVAIQLQTLFLDDMSSKFPNLKALTIRLKLRSMDVPFFKRVGVIQITISSPSLETLNFIVDENECWYAVKNVKLIVVFDVRAEFDVPSIRKFTFEGEYMPKILSFRSISAYQWESRVKLTHHGELGAMWFCELSKFLSNLRTSKIHLCLHVDNTKSFDYRKGEIEKGFNVVELENLTMNTKGLPTLSFQALLDVLFRICRPNMITQYARYPRDDNDVDRRIRNRNMLVRPPGIHDANMFRDMLGVPPGIHDANMFPDMFGVPPGIHDPNMLPNMVGRPLAPGIHHPNMIARLPDSNDADLRSARNNDLFLFRALAEGMNTKSFLIRSQYMYGLRDLEEVYVQKLFDGVWIMQPPTDSIMDSIMTGRLRLLLKWKPLS